VQISVDGGWFPQWRHDGKELFFLDDNAQYVMAVDIKAGSTIEPGKPKVFFKRPANVSYYDVSPDGQRIIASINPAAGSALDESHSPLTVVLNWATAIGKK
jgi:Tol biopolymer transport system component